MIYRDYKGMKLPLLAFGAMRLPVNNGNDAEINVSKTEELVKRAFESGINYFDTAWGYHGGNSETVMGDILSKYPRDSYFISTKFPGYDTSNFGKVEEIFEKQLEKCKVDYFDFYFIHNVCELNIEKYLDDCQYMTVSYLLEQKKKGRIKHLGFSAHGSPETLERFLEKYGQHMEFGMIQMNYVDYYFQDAKAKAEMLNKRNIPIWVMEPLRGGMLANLPASDMEKLNGLRPGINAVEWAFRFIESVPGVTTILSGMTEMSQMEEKIAVFKESKPMNGMEQQTLSEIADRLLNEKTVPCTACKYCLSHCPKGLDIPELIKQYNENSFTGGGFLAPFVLQSLPAEKRPSSCIGCKACEKVCPQQIKISEILKKLDKDTEAILKAFFGSN